MNMPVYLGLSILKKIYMGIGMVSQKYIYEKKLLREKISFKGSRMKTLEKDFNTRRRKLRGTLSIIDYTHVCFWFLNNSYKKLKNQQEIHSKTLFNLGIESSKTSHNPQKVIFNYPLMY